jgi:nitrite reductase/ring-hydroxylating ferredoxin subunit
LRDVIERLSGYVDDLLAERRPRRFLAQSADELRLLQAAARLRGARPGADQPDPGFLADLRQQLADHPTGVTPEVAPSPAPVRRSRRRLLASAVGLVGGLAATLAAGFGLGRLSAPSPVPTEPIPSDGGRWYRVAALTDLPVRKVLRFVAGPLVGHLVNSEDGLYALSAVCTHQGCLLRWRKQEREFECPCHGAAFDLVGRMTYGPASYRDPLPPLPVIATRVQDGQVFVWTPGDRS